MGSLFVKTTQRKKGQNLAPQKDTPLRIPLSLSLSLEFSLSAIRPLLWKANTTVERRRKRKRRGRRRRRRPFRFVERRRKSARERILFCVFVRVCGRIQIQTRESKRYPGIRIFRWRLYRSSDSGAWGHVLCAARRLFFLCVRFKTREKKKRWVRRGLVAMVIVGIADDAWHRRR